MKVDLRVVAAVGFVFGASYELGRIAPGVVVRVFSKRFRNDVRVNYRRRMHVVRNETPTMTYREKKMHDSYERDRQRLKDMREDGN